MKAALILLSIVAATSAQEAFCRCGAFVTYEHTEIMVHEEPLIDIPNCDADGALSCKTQCADVLSTLTNNGDLWSMTESGETVGQYVCNYLVQHLHPFLHNHRLYGYYEVCGGAWQYTGLQSQQMLCCNGGKHEHCITM